MQLALYISIYYIPDPDAPQDTAACKEGEEEREGMDGHVDVYDNESYYR